MAQPTTSSEVLTRDRFKVYTMESTQDRHRLMFGTRGPDYASDADALDNFKRRAHQLRTTPIKICLGDMSKHFEQVCGNLTGELPSRGQAITERLDDIQNYIDLLRGLLYVSR